MSNIPTQKKPRLYALLIGIANYASEIRLANETVRFPKLTGCVSDAKKVALFLKRDDYYEINIRTLFDKEASKKAIVQTFQDHFSQATEEDVILFYFSGHGTQEYIDKTVFKSETDGKSESIVCYYDEENKNDFLLSDKEFRWLINKSSFKSPHILTIFDCCHSAGITRNAEMVEATFSNSVEKRIPFIFPKRKWKSFIFSEITEEEFLSKGELIILPESPHIELTACESNEAAMEVAGEGVFTKALLKVLESSKEQISYQTLHNRIRQYLRGVYEQKASIYSVSLNQNILLSAFLNKHITSTSGIGEVTYNARLGWQVNIGAIHGLSTAAKTMTVFDPSDFSRVYIAKVGLVKTDTTQLLLESHDLNKEKIYKINLTGLLSKKLLVYIAPQNALPEDQEKLILRLLTHASSEYLDLVDDENDCNYVLRFQNGFYFITRPYDSFRPLTKLIQSQDNDIWVNELIEQFKHISTWAFLKNLRNDECSIQLPENAFAIKVATGIPLQPRENTSVQQKVIINLEEINGQLVSKIKIEITNLLEIDIYCCAVYLTSNFQSFVGFLNPNVYHLEPNESVILNLRGKEELSITAPEAAKWYNYEKIDDCLKFIVSTEKFEAIGLCIDSLPEPPSPKAGQLRSTNPKGIETSVEEESISGWCAYDLPIEFVNPNFNCISSDDLQTMVENNLTSYFAIGLYYNSYIDSNLLPVYNINTEIQIKGSAEADNEKGLVQNKVIDIANWYARRNRNQFYKNIVSRFPERLRIVSEGDSWFQHPLVLDIVDHLSKVYAIYCVAAAGDTLSNYLSDDKKRGEYFLDAIDEKEPSYFLISGGGNDILGLQFREFLVDQANQAIEINKKSDEFLRDSFFNKLIELMEIYKATFSLLEVTKPMLQILVHGYDYPVKLNDSKHGWLGKYMIEKGIRNPQDRKNLIHFVMDEFNENLEKTCKLFKNVHYLDVRNIVRYNENDNVDQWYDEIHPNNEGFQQIAMRFIQKISSIETSKQLL